ncbi:Gluconate transport-inducing protein [Coemansia sp. BCRC 34301]|nr:Gluconate transport-inducing protein [Coemansia sp. BCRC 34301]
MGDTRMETYYGFVSTSEDALALFEACRLGYKQRVPRRLSDAERSAIRSGSVFVWEEGESGMKRWTDGRSWSPSRVQGCFLTYHEWEGRRRAQRHPSTYQHQQPGHHSMQLQGGAYSLPISVHGLPPNHHHHQPMGIARYGHFIGGPTKAGSTQVQYGMPKENGMLKKALSIRTNNGKKLHIIAYYSKDDHVKRRLLTPTTDPNFPRLDVPPNLYPDMSPESMYGAGHSSINYNSANDVDSDYVTRTTPDHQQLDIVQTQRRPVHNLSIHRAVAPPSLPSSPNSSSSSCSLTVEDMSAAFHKARVQSLVTASDVPPASAFTYKSRPAPEHGYRGEPLLLQPLSAPSSGSTAYQLGVSSASSRPSSNSFSFGGAGSCTSTAMGASYSSESSSSASAPASSVMRSAVATGSSGVHGVASAPDENGGASSSIAYMNGGASGAGLGSGGYRSRYTGLGLGSGGGASSGGGSSSAPVAGNHRATPLRSVTTAAVMMHPPSLRQPLLLSPISAPTTTTHGISLAGIRRDVKEGPRRLPSISASLHRDSDRLSPPADTVSSNYSSNGLGIFTPASGISSANIPPLPSPMATPRQSIALGFEGGSGDSLSLLALAADRAQGRNSSSSSRVVSVSGHHPYSRPWKRGPSMRSVSLKQSEDVRQLGALDQGLKLNWYVVGDLLVKAYGASDGMWGEARQVVVVVSSAMATSVPGFVKGDTGDQDKVEESGINGRFVERGFWNTPGVAGETQERASVRHMDHIHDMTLAPRYVEGLALSEGKLGEGEGVGLACVHAQEYADVLGALEGWESGDMCVDKLGCGGDMDEGVVGAYFAKTLLSSWVPADIARHLAQHRHVWVRLNGTEESGRSWQAWCRDCLCQCEVTTTSSEERSCVDRDGHHFHGGPTGSLECATRCCKCALRVAATLRVPELIPSVVQALERARTAPHAHHPTQGARALLSTVGTLYKITRNAANGDSRPIRTSNPRLRQLLQFDEPCVRLLEDTLGFQLRGDEYHPPPKDLGHVRDELAVWAARVQRKLPDAERVPPELAYVDAVAWLGCEYARQRSVASATGDAWCVLGVPADAADAVVAWAYRRRVEEDAETGGPRAQRRYDALAAVCAARVASPELLTLVDAERDRGLVAASAVRSACGVLFGDPLINVNMVDSDTLRDVFGARLSATRNPAERLELAAHLAVLACAKGDAELERHAALVKASADAPQRITARMQAPVGLANIGNTCYLNCMLQCLFSVAPVRSAVLRFGDGVTWNESCDLGRTDEGRRLTEEEVRRALQFVALLRDLFGSLATARAEAWTSRKAPSNGHPLASPLPAAPVVTPARELADMLLQSSTSSSNMQQDVDECMAQCVSLLGHALPPSPDNTSWIELLLAGHLELTTASGSASQPPPSIETFVNLSLNLPANQPSADINECLAAFFAPSEIHLGDKALVRSSRIADAPPVLCMQVQRVQFDMSSMRAFKINSHLRLREKVSLARFAHPTEDRRLCELQEKLRSVDRSLAALALPVASGGGVLGALDQAHAFMAGVGEWAQKDDAQKVLEGLAPEHVHHAQTIAAHIGALASALNDSKRQWDAERAETLSEIDTIYESVPEDDPLAYTLHAVFIHSGMTPEFGHYWVYIRDEDDDGVRWLKFNDSSVTVVDDPENAIFGGASDGVDCANPYYLVYVRSLDVHTIADLAV